MEHKDISRSDERLIWCERESRAASQTLPLLPLTSSLPSLLTGLTPSLDLTVQAAAGALHSSVILPRHILGLWAVIPAVSIVQCLTPEGDGSVCVSVSEAAEAEDVFTEVARSRCKTRRRNDPSVDDLKNTGSLLY